MNDTAGTIPLGTLARLHDRLCRAGHVTDVPYDDTTPVPIGKAVRAVADTAGLSDAEALALIQAEP